MQLFYQRWFLFMVVTLNTVGTVWGVLWYWEQLIATPWYFLPVVPDSPLHAFFFALYLYWLLADDDISGRWQQFVAWAGVLGVIKYGLWTTVILSQYLLSQWTSPGLVDLLLYISHLGMALEGIIYAKRLPRAPMVLIPVIIWFAGNDFCDYVFYTHPRLPLSDQVPVAGVTNVVLTLLVWVIGSRILRLANYFTSDEKNL